MMTSRNRMAAIVAIAAAVLAGSAPAGRAKADGSAAAPFGPALLGATLAVIGIGTGAMEPGPPAARGNSPPALADVAPPRAMAERGGSPPPRPTAIRQAHTLPAR